MKKRIAFWMVTLLTAHWLSAQDTIMPLWPKTVPNQTEIGEKELDTVEHIRWIRNVQRPTLEVYLPSVQNTNGKAVLLFPGGGYQGLAYNWEGVDFAKAFNAKGIVGIVVKYRLPISKSIHKNRWDVPLQDAQRAIRLVRSMSATWKIDPDKIGIMGFSAGGHLASTLGTQYDKKVYDHQDIVDTISARPNFMALVYPVISMDSTLTHGGSKDALLGENPTDVLLQEFSNETRVDANTPPAFLIHATDDAPVPVENSLRFFKALRQHNVPSSLHVYPSGGHGFALARQHPLLKNWLDLFLDWLDYLD
nr:alpha/beta hydrolase [Allomuricauda sp.]